MAFAFFEKHTAGLNSFDSKHPQVLKDMLHTYIHTFIHTHITRIQSLEISPSSSEIDHKIALVVGSLASYATARSFLARELMITSL